MKLNSPARTEKIYTHEGAVAKRINPELQLRRSVMACMLWEDSFYENGDSITDRIINVIPNVPPLTVASIAIEAREKMKLRHVPLLLVREMARLDTHKNLTASTLSHVIQRADELSEFLSIYWKDGRQPLSAQVKKGLAKAFQKFNRYQLAKYDRPTKIKLRDVLFLTHPTPKDAQQEADWSDLVEGTLEPPQTWEVLLSTCKNEGEKKQVWVGLLSEHKLGAMALLRNLRNMQSVGVDTPMIKEALASIKVERVLPFRFIAAARYAPQLEPELEQAMFKCLEGYRTIEGRTVLLVDVSGSMNQALSSRSDMTRMDAACGLAILARQICSDVLIYTFSNRLVPIPPRRGFSLRDTIDGSQGHYQTLLGKAIQSIKESPDRIIIITDEQAHDHVPDPSGRGYVINIASDKNGVGYGAWTHIDGWSEAVLDYIQEYELLE